MASDWTDAELSTLYTATFLFSALGVMLYGAACSRINFRRLVPGVYIFFAASFLALYAAIKLAPDAGLLDKIFYVWVSVFSLFHVSVFWSFMADVFSRSQAPRLFGFIASGSSAGAIAGPTIALTLVGAVGTEQLMLVSAALLIVPVFFIRAVEAARTELTGGSSEVLAQADADGPAMGGNPFAGFSMFLKDPYLLGIGLFILLYTAISTFVYFELKNLLAGVDEAVRVQVWSGMDLAVNILGIGTAMFGTSRLTTRFGLAVTLALVPVVIVAGLLVVAAAPMLWVVIGLQVVRRAGNYSITRPGREMLFTVVDREARFKAKSVIDIVVYRGGDTLTAWAFTGLTQGLGLGLGAVAIVGAGIAAIWAFLAGMLGRAYARAHPAESDAGDTASASPPNT
jgi:AAA family ATP:ADP antiporter